MTKTKNIALALLLAGMLAAGTAGAALAVKTDSASALGTDSTVTYPFEKGVDAFQYAPSFTMATSQADHWEFGQVFFDEATHDFTDVKYIAVQMRIDEGNMPRLCVGVINGQNRFRSQGSDAADTFYFLEENGTIHELTEANDDIPFTKGWTGALIMPTEHMAWQTQGDITKIDSFYFTANSLYFWNYKLTIGEIGYYTADPASGAAMTKLVDLSGGERNKSKYGGNSSNPSYLKMPSEASIPDPDPLVFDYPFRTGEDKEYYTATWTGFINGDQTDNFQEVKVKFDEATVDFSNADYLLLQVKMAGSPGVQYILNEGTRSNVPKDGKAFYFYPDNGTQANFAGRVVNAHITFSNANMGALVIPISTLAGNADLTKIDSVSFKTNSRWNGGFSLTIGEIGMYKGTAGSGTFTKLLDLSEAKNGKFTVSTSQTDSQNKGRLDFNEGEPPITQLGDASVDFNANKHQASDFAVWNGGGSGTVAMTKDSYGLDAVQITPSGVSAGKDSYMATTLSSGGFSWANKKGVSFWARNDSDTEIHFNVEVDCKKNNVSDRFNVEGGHRYYLYDVRTQRTTIYMTRATATMGPVCLPVGFEGWIRVPFSAYHKADWSEGGFAVSDFMKEGTTVSYLAITVQANEFKNKTFSVNLFGAYETTPSYSSVFVQSENTIDKLMELDDLELQDPIASATSEIALEEIDLIVSKEEY